jgi:hypothetical protein
MMVTKADIELAISDGLTNWENWPEKLGPDPEHFPDDMRETLAKLAQYEGEVAMSEKRPKELERQLNDLAAYIRKATATGYCIARICILTAEKDSFKLAVEALGLICEPVDEKPVRRQEEMSMDVVWGRHPHSK